MSDHELILKNPPIVEAVLDIDCDLPPTFDLVAVESAAREAFRDPYKNFRVQLMQEHTIEATGEEAKHAVRHTRQALQFLTEDERQLVQVRTGGFSFNRLAPYRTLDVYLPEIERAWGVYRKLTYPIAVRRINIRMINRILIPLRENRSVELNDYFNVGPKLADEENMVATGFLNQYSAIEKETGNQLSVVLTGQPFDADAYPIIFDITVSADIRTGDEPSDWRSLCTTISSIRSLKNRVFKNTITERCLNLFQ